MFLETEHGHGRGRAERHERRVLGRTAPIYHQWTARFVQPDPIGYEAGMNLYGYVGGDPVNRGDPSGTRSSKPCPLSTGSILCGVEPGGLIVNGIDVMAANGAARMHAQDSKSTASSSSLLSPIRSANDRISCVNAAFKCVILNSKNSDDTTQFPLNIGSIYGHTYVLQGRVSVGPLASMGVVDLLPGTRQIVLQAYAPPNFAVSDPVSTFMGFNGSVTIWISDSDHIPVNRLGSFDFATTRAEFTNSRPYNLPEGGRYVFIIGQQNTAPQTVVTVWGRSGTGR